jgi:hypothetical protein
MIPTLLPADGMNRRSAFGCLKAVNLDLGLDNGDSEIGAGARSAGGKAA